MEKRTHPLKNVKVELRHSPLALKVIVTVLILFSMAALITLRWVHDGLREQTENLRNEAAAMEYANSELEEKTQSLGSVQSIQDIAKEELGLVDPNMVIIDTN